MRCGRGIRRSTWQRDFDVSTNSGRPELFRSSCERGSAHRDNFLNAPVILRAVFVNAVTAPGMRFVEYYSLFPWKKRVRSEFVNVVLESSCCSVIRVRVFFEHFGGCGPRVEEQFH